jgi:3-hydroxyacyl-[acyl-carrier-protein] dehydratase
MLLADDFYIASPITSDNSSVLNTQIEFNGAHPIFAAHFPNQPIVPGACLVQISKEILEHYHKNKITILNFKSLKFIKTIDPHEFPKVIFTVTISQKESDIAAQISIGFENIIFGKLDFQYTLSHD